MTSSNKPSKNHFFSLFKIFVFLIYNVETETWKINFFQKVKIKCSNQFVSLKHTLWTCSEWVFGLKPKIHLFWEKWKKHFFSYKKTIIFVAIFEKTQIFDRKNFSQTFIFRLPKQSTFIHFLSIYPIFGTKTELLGDVYQKTCFLPFFAPHFLYKSTHNKILAKRGKSVSLEFQYGAACKKLGNFDLQFSRSSVFPGSITVEVLPMTGRAPTPGLQNHWRRSADDHLGQSFTCGALVFFG